MTNPRRRAIGIAVVVAVLVIALGVGFAVYRIINPVTASERNSAIQTLAQIAGGAALLLSLIFTWRTLRINQEGQITERFTRAVDQLGSDKLGVRLGGIYALERIARDSERDHWPIMEILTAFVRIHAPWSPQPQADLPQPTPEVSAPPRPPADIEAVAAALARRAHWYENDKDQVLDLHETDLRRVHLHGVHLEDAYLRATHLESSHLREAHLRGADLKAAHLQGARLLDADLQETHLEGADLTNAIGLTWEQLDSAITDETTKHSLGPRPEPESQPPAS